MTIEQTRLIATGGPSTERLAKALDADFERLPSVEAPESFESWRMDALAARASSRRIVVAVWNDSAAPGELLGVDADAWRKRFELPYLLWNFALGVAGQQASDGGAIVAVVQSPAALDCPGWTPEFAIADGLLALVRSVAAAEGARGVRANLVTTPVGLVEGEVVAPPPPLSDFPGTIEEHVAGAVRMLLSSDAQGLTGRVLAADGGRAL